MKQMTLLALQSIQTPSVAWTGLLPIIILAAAAVSELAAAVAEAAALVSDVAAAVAEFAASNLVFVRL